MLLMSTMWPFALTRTLYYGFIPLKNWNTFWRYIGSLVARK